MPIDEAPTFIALLRKQAGLSARALEFCIFTAARSGEVLGATWDEVDLDARVWSVPANRMKAGRAHRVPLAPRATEILCGLRELRQGDFVFPGQKPGRPLSNMSMTMQLRRLGAARYTVHGFRSTFRDWVGERTDHAERTAEAALAHVVGDATERAYRRGDALEKRRVMMEDWARFLAPDEASSIADRPDTATSASLSGARVLRLQTQ